MVVVEVDGGNVIVVDNGGKKYKDNKCFWMNGEKGGKRKKKGKDKSKDMKCHDWVVCKKKKKKKNWVKSSQKVCYTSQKSKRNKKEKRRKTMEKKCQKIHLKINGLYYFYIEKLLRSNLLYVHEIFLSADFSSSSSSSFPFQGKERNLPFARLVSSPPHSNFPSYTFNRINGLFMFFLISSTHSLKRTYSNFWIFFLSPLNYAIALEFYT